MSDIDLMVGREAGQWVQSICHCESRFIGTKQFRGGMGCHTLLAMAKVLLDKSGDYKVRRIVGIG